VFVSANDPVGFGFVKSIARPGGNITGFVSYEPAKGGKWLEIVSRRFRMDTQTACWRLANDKGA
jgi:hypothetical protein